MFRKLTATLCLTAALFLGNVWVAYSHGATQPLTLDDWLRKNPKVQSYGEVEITAECNKRETYNEVLLGKARIELNQHKKNKNNSDNSLDPFSITLWGWINSFGIRTADYDLFWHGKPAMYRWNTSDFKGSVVTKKLFTDIGQQGKFKFYLEPNQIRCPECLSVMVEIKVSNPDVILNCFD